MIVILVGIKKITEITNNKIHKLMSINYLSLVWLKKIWEFSAGIWYSVLGHTLHICLHKWSYFDGYSVLKS